MHKCNKYVKYDMPYLAVSRLTDHGDLSKH